jgi:hypothetical protein
MPHSDWGMPDRTAQLEDITAPTTLAGQMSASGDFGSIMSGVLSGLKTGFEGITGSTFGGGADAKREAAIQLAMTKDDIKTMISIRDDEFMKSHGINKGAPPRVKYTLGSVHNKSLAASKKSISDRERQQWGLKPQQAYDPTKLAF